MRQKCVCICTLLLFVTCNAQIGGLQNPLGVTIPSLPIGNIQSPLGVTTPNAPIGTLQNPLGAATSAISLYTQFAELWEEVVGGTTIEEFVSQSSAELFRILDIVDALTAQQTTEAEAQTQQALSEAARLQAEAQRYTEALGLLNGATSSSSSSTLPTNMDVSGTSSTVAGNSKDSSSSTSTSSMEGDDDKGSPSDSSSSSSSSSAGDKSKGGVAPSTKPSDSASPSSTVPTSSTASSELMRLKAEASRMEAERQAVLQQIQKLQTEEEARLRAEAVRMQAVKTLMELTSTAAQKSSPSTDPAELPKLDSKLTELEKVAKSLGAPSTATRAEALQADTQNPVNDSSNFEIVLAAAGAVCAIAGSAIAFIIVHRRNYNREERSRRDVRKSSQGQVQIDEGEGVDWTVEHDDVDLEKGHVRLEGEWSDEEDGEGEYYSSYSGPDPETIV